MENRENEVFKPDGLVDDFIIGEGFSIAGEEKPKTPVKKRKKMNKSLKTIIWLVGVFVVAAGLAVGALYAVSDYTGIGPGRGNEYTIEVSDGSNLKAVAEVLNENGIVKSKFLFKAYSKLKGYHKRYQTGVFVINDDDGYAGIATKLVHVGHPISTVKVRIPEMASVDEIIKILAENNVGNEKTLRSAIQSGEYKYDFLNGIPEQKVYWRLEGYLFPDTYEFYNYDDHEQCAKFAIDKLLGEMNNRFTAEMREKATQMGYSMHEILTLASIIELEAGGASFEDKQKVAEIFYNRLKDWGDAALLQSNPTRNYPYGEGAYNTYEKAGLPVGPLCSPSIDSIKAALEPSTSQAGYYYFITDKNMKFYYNKTLNAHINTQNRLMREGMYAG